MIVEDPSTLGRSILDDHDDGAGGARGEGVTGALRGSVTA